MADDGPDHEALYEAVRRGTRDGLREVLWDVVTVVFALVLVSLGVPRRSRAPAVAARRPGWRWSSAS